MVILKAAALLALSTQIVFLAPGYSVRSEPPAQADEIDAQITGDTPIRPQIVRGERGELVAFGRGLDIRSVQVESPDGVSVESFKETKPDPDDNRQLRPGVRVWSLTIQTLSTARAGEHSLILVTPAGRSKPLPLRVATHLPKISDLTIVSATASDGDVRIRFSVFDAEGDVNPENAPINRYLLKCGQSFAVSFGRSERVEMKNSQQSTVYATASFADHHGTLEGPCTLEMRITDEGGNDSNRLSAQVVFEPNHIKRRSSAMTPGSRRQASG